jgi:hypothetical protein
METPFSMKKIVTGQNCRLHDSASGLTLTFFRERPRRSIPGGGSYARSGDEPQAGGDAGNLALTLHHRRVRQVKAGGDFAKAQTIGEMSQNYPVWRVEPAAEGGKDVSRRHHVEDRVLGSGIQGKVVGTTAFAGNVCSGVGQADAALAVFQRINAAALSQEVEQVELAAFQIPARALSGPLSPELPQMNHGFLQEIFTKASIRGDCGHHAKQGSVDFRAFTGVSAFVAQPRSLIELLMGSRVPGDPIFLL